MKQIKIMSQVEIEEQYGYTKEDMLKDLKQYDKELYDEIKNSDKKSGV